MYYTCEQCGAAFTRSYNLDRHKRESCMERWSVRDCEKRRRIDGSTSMLMCDVCNISIASNKMAAHRRSLEHRNNSCLPMAQGVQVIQSAFKNRIVTYRISSDREHVDYSTFFEEVKDKVLDLLKEILRVQKTLKVNMVAVARYLLPSQDTYDDKSFNTSNAVVVVGSDLDEVYESFVEAMKNQSTEFQERDSGMCFRL